MIRGQGMKTVCKIVVDLRFELRNLTPCVTSFAVLLIPKRRGRTTGKFYEGITTEHNPEESTNGLQSKYRASVSGQIPQTPPL